MRRNGCFIPLGSLGTHRRTSVVRSRFVFPSSLQRIFASQRQSSKHCLKFSTAFIIGFQLSLPRCALSLSVFATLLAATLRAICGPCALVHLVWQLATLRFLFLAWFSFQSIYDTDVFCGFAHASFFCWRLSRSIGILDKICKM